MADITPMSKKQAQFFAGLILICTITAALVLVVDYQIKGAILEQAMRLRQEIEGWQRGQSTAAASSNGSNNYTANDVSYPSDLVHGGTTRMETTGSNGHATRQGNAKKARTVEPRRADGSGEIPGTDK